MWRRGCLMVPRRRLPGHLWRWRLSTASGAVWSMDDGNSPPMDHGCDRGLERASCGGGG
uniref:Uncharacterized protein n=1 Tax=Setaria italica TaxID=4555 RepID=K3XTF2_SETIT